MSDGGRERASLGMNGWKSSQKWRVQRSAVRSIAWLDAFNLSDPPHAVSEVRNWNAMLLDSEPPINLARIIDVHEV